MEKSRLIAARITAKAWTDPAFKARLLADPGTVMREHGMVVPRKIAVHMHENTATDRHVVLSLKPTGLTPRDLAHPERFVPMACQHFLNLPSERPRSKPAKKRKPRKAAKKSTKKK